MKKALFSLYYAAPIQYYASLLKLSESTDILFDLGEHYQKRSYRNRCIIGGANGKLMLSVPLKHGKNQRKPMKEVFISYNHPWQKLHWDSLCSAYRRSPFFEYYEHDIYPIYHTQYDTLVEFNEALLQLTLRLINFTLSYEKKNEYVENVESALDFRTHFSVKDKVLLPKYHQVFEQRNGFLSNLSIWDLIFHKGNNSIHYLKECI